MLLRKRSKSEKAACIPATYHSGKCRTVEIVRLVFVRG
jgi:hypothetical protein